VPVLRLGGLPNFFDIFHGQPALLLGSINSRLLLSGTVQYMNHVYCQQPYSAIIMSPSVSFEKTGACLHVMECHFEVSKYGRRQFKARSSGRFEALASKCSRFITMEIFLMPARGLVDG